MSNIPTIQDPAQKPSGQAVSNKNEFRKEGQNPAAIEDSDDSDDEPSTLFAQRPSQNPAGSVSVQTASREGSPKIGSKSDYAQRESNEEALLKENKLLREEIFNLRQKGHLEAFKAVSAKILGGEYDPDKLEEVPRALERKFDQLTNMLKPSPLFHRVLKVSRNEPARNSVHMEELSRFLTRSQTKLNVCCTDFYPLQNLVLSEDFSPSVELQKHLANVTCSDRYSLEKLRKAVRLTPRFAGDADVVTVAVIMSIMTDMVMNDPFPASDLDRIFDTLMNERTKVLTDQVRKNWSELRRDLGLQLLESDPYANVIPGRVQELLQKLKTLIHPLIGKSRQSAQVKWEAVMKKILTEAIYIHVALRCNKSKVKWSWPKAHELHYDQSCPAHDRVGKELWFAEHPIVTARLPKWEGHSIDFKIDPLEVYSFEKPWTIKNEEPLVFGDTDTEERDEVTAMNGELASTLLPSSKDNGISSDSEMVLPQRAVSQHEDPISKSEDSSEMLEPSEYQKKRRAHDTDYGSSGRKRARLGNGRGDHRKAGHEDDLNNAKDTAAAHRNRDPTSRTSSAEAAELDESSCHDFRVLVPLTSDADRDAYSNGAGLKKRKRVMTGREKTNKKCPNCDEPHSRPSDRCRPCDEYWIKNKTERSRILIEKCWERRKMGPRSGPKKERRDSGGAARDRDTPSEIPGRNTPSENSRARKSQVERYDYDGVGKYMGGGRAQKTKDDGEYRPSAK